MFLACLQDRRALDLASVAEAEEEDVLYCTILLSIVKHVVNQLLQFLEFPFLKSCPSRDKTLYQSTVVVFFFKQFLSVSSVSKKHCYYDGNNIDRVRRYCTMLSSS